MTLRSHKSRLYRWKHTKRTFQTLTIRVKIKIARTYCRVDFHHQWKLCLPQFQITPRTSGANMHTFREYVPSVRWKSVSRPLCQPKSAQNEGGNGAKWVFAGTEVRWTRRGGLMSFYYIKICSNCNGSTPKMVVSICWWEKWFPPHGATASERKIHSALGLLLLYKTKLNFHPTQGAFTLSEATLSYG